MADITPFAGALNRKIQVFKTVSMVNEVGEPKPTDVLVCAPYAAMQDKSGSTEIDGAVIAVVNRVYTIYRRKEIVTGGRAMFVMDGGIKFLVDGLREIGRTHVELTCITAL